MKYNMKYYTSAKMDAELKINDASSSKNTAVELILPTLEQPHSVGKEDIQGLPPLHENSLSFSDQTKHLNHGREQSGTENQTQRETTQSTPR